MKKPDTKPAAKYAREMIPHHQMAVDMSRKLLRGEPRPKIKAFAEKVIEAQTREIEWLRDWLKQKPAPAPVSAAPRPGTREYREAQRAEFGKRFEAAKRGHK